MSDVVAEVVFHAEVTPGNRVRVVLTIERPIRRGETHVEEWTCRMAMQPIQAARDIHAGSAIQALGLALSGAQQVLRYFVEDGGLLYFEDGTPWTDGSLALGAGFSPPPDYRMDRTREP